VALPQFLHRPDYQGSGIVDLMRSLERALDAPPQPAAVPYPERAAFA